MGSSMTILHSSSVFFLSLYLSSPIQIRPPIEVNEFSTLPGTVANVQHDQLILLCLFHL